MIFAVDHPLCDVWNQKKTQFLIECLDRTQKSTASRQKKYSKGLEEFVYDFCCWPPPMWCLKAKNSNSYCSSEGRNRLNPKKSSYSAKKVWLGLRGFCTCFWEVDHPMWCLKYPGVQVFGKAKIYKPTWTKTSNSSVGINRAEIRKIIA